MKSHVRNLKCLNNHYESPRHKQGSGPVTASFSLPSSVGCLLTQKRLFIVLIPLRKRRRDRISKQGKLLEKGSSYRSLRKTLSRGTQSENKM